MLVFLSRLVVQQFPDQQEEILQLRHNKFAEPGNVCITLSLPCTIYASFNPHFTGHVRPHYGAFAEPKVIALQEQEMQCEVPLSLVHDYYQHVNMIN